MLMGQQFNYKSTRQIGAGGRGRAIVMVAPRTLTAECLVEVLMKNFPDNDVSRRDHISHLSDEEGEDARLVLLYRPAPETIWDMLERLHDHATEQSIGIVVESIDEAEDIFQQISGTEGVDGVVSLDLRLDVFLAAVRLLVKGGEHFPSALLQRLRRFEGDLPITRYGSTRAEAGEGSHGAPDPAAIALTTREIQILDLLCNGTQNKIIADRLRLSENTVKVHIRNIYKKMGVRNRTEAASQFFKSDFAATLKPKRKD